MKASEGRKCGERTRPLVTPLGGLPIPSMFREFSQQIVREPAGIARRDVGIDMRELAHAGNDRANDWVAKDKAQSHLRHADSSSLGDWFEGVGALDTGDQVFRYEVNIAPVAFRPLAFFSERAGQRAFVKWHAGNYRRIHLDAGREKIILRTLIEDVVDHLHRINQTALHRAYGVPGFPAVDADADSFD